jgi:hypothetical protein
MMKEEQYLTERLQDQIDWYDQKSQFNQFFLNLSAALNNFCSKLLLSFCAIFLNILY